MVGEDSYFCYIPQSAQEFCHFFDLIAVVSRDVGDAYLYRLADAVYVPEIVQYQSVRLPGAADVYVLVDGFQIIQKYIRIFHDFFDTRPWDVSAGVHRCADIVFFQLAQQLGTEIRLTQTLSAGQRHSAAAVFIKLRIFQQLRHELLDGDLSAVELSRAAETYFLAFSACDALVTGADALAFAAADAFVRIKRQLGLESDPLGVVTPDAFQGAALEKHCGAYAVAVMYGEPLDLEYCCFHGFLPNCF